MVDEGTQKKGSRLVVPLLVAVIVILLVLIFTVTPLRNIIFPEKAAPEIALALAGIPEWDEDLGMYSFLVEATVTGNPAPNVNFSRNDNLAEAGPNRSLIILEPGEIFTLEATATNTEGTAEAVIELIADEAEFAGLMGDETADPAAGDPEDSDADGAALPEEGAEDLPDPADPAPRITAVTFRGENITAMTGRGDSPPVENIVLDYVEEEHEFTFQVDWGEDGDSRRVTLLTAHGRVGPHSDLNTSSDVMIASWFSPDSPGGSLEPLETYVQLIISTNSGAYTDKRKIGITLEPVAIRAVPLEEYTRTVSADTGLSGYVTSAGLVRTGTIMVGDDTANNQIKGYLTFNTASMASIPRERITAVSIRFSHVNKSGNPEGFSDFVDFKVFDYGSTLDPGDFAIGGRRFYMNRSDIFSTGSTATGTLIAELRSVLDAGSSRLQVKIGLDGVTDSDGTWDIFQFNPSMVFLDVYYTE